MWASLSKASPLSSLVFVASQVQVQVLVCTTRYRCVVYNQGRVFTHQALSGIPCMRRSHMRAHMESGAAARRACKLSHFRVQLSLPHSRSSSSKSSSKSVNVNGVEVGRAHARRARMQEGRACKRGAHVGGRTRENAAHARGRAREGEACVHRRRGPRMRAGERTIEEVCVGLLGWGLVVERQAIVRIDLHCDATRRTAQRRRSAVRARRGRRRTGVQQRWRGLARGWWLMRHVPLPREGACRATYCPSGASPKRSPTRCRRG